MLRSLIHSSGLALVCSFALAPVSPAIAGWDDPASFDPSAATDKEHTGRIEMHSLNPALFSAVPEGKRETDIPEMERIPARSEAPLSRFTPEPGYEAMITPPVIVEEERDNGNWILPPRPADLEEEPDILEDPYGALESRLQELNENATEALDKMIGSDLQDALELGLQESDLLDEQLSDLLGATNPFNDSDEQDDETLWEQLEEAGLVGNDEAVSGEGTPSNPVESTDGYEPVVSTTSFEDDVVDSGMPDYEGVFMEETGEPDLDQPAEEIVITSLDLQGSDVNHIRGELTPGLFETKELSGASALPRSAKTLAKIRADIAGWDTGAGGAGTAEEADRGAWKSDMPFLAGTFQKAVQGVQPPLSSASLPGTVPAFSSSGAGDARGLGSAVSGDGFKPVGFSPASGVYRGALPGQDIGSFNPGSSFGAGSAARGFGGSFSSPDAQTPRVSDRKRGFDARTLEPLLN